ncbi:DEAD/DEAH box helicase [Methylobacterium isbiliense]|uniref:ATP-dependent RNA helicase RhlE n=2 Tax=Methylobacterium isbiliense TaxID=315478 RepID=A0ABQ4SHP1_9HYPH|nr:DEAD/DEAH box helicase [Methylobacterium isbiliense]GJE02642.1 ATP-dependent RNA helicase RhlE [Methylobacterium isbiliense]
MTQFVDFGLAAPILKALAETGYVTPTPIQAQAIPPAMEGRDLCGIAQTGTGKTAAFALPILHRLVSEATPRRAPRGGCRVLVLSPTRELASQIADSFRDYGKFLKLSTTVVFGGVTIGRQERALANGVDVLVATPGRLLDLIDRRALTLQAVEYLVLDEADQMLDLGFIHALKRIVTLLPKARQSLFFSATMPKNIAGLAAQYLRDPVQVAVTPVATTAERVEQRVVHVPTGSKQALLGTILRDDAIDRVLVFTRTKHGADRVVRGLEKAGIGSAAIHGNKSQPQRERALAAFRAGTCRVLVATDIAARGIDVEGVSHVVNFDLPNVPEAYVHRIGRTARAGADGLAISFCNDEERAYLRDIERLTRQKVPEMAMPAGFVAPSRQEAALAEAEAERDRRQPGPRGQRPGARPQGQRPHGHGGRPHEGRQAGPGRPRQDGRPQEARPGRQDGRPAPHRAEGHGRPQGQGQRRDRAPAPGGQDGRAIGWLDRAPR